MRLEIIKKVIVDQREEIEDFFRKEKIIERSLDIEKLKGFLKHPNILVISGVRRSEKSTLATMIFKDKKYGYLNFDDERLAGFDKNDFDKALQSFGYNF